MRKAGSVQVLYLDMYCLVSLGDLQCVPSGAARALMLRSTVYRRADVTRYLCVCVFPRAILIGDLYLSPELPKPL